MVVQEIAMVVQTLEQTRQTVDTWILVVPIVHGFLVFHAI